nr:U32 family peptidase [Xylanibacter muris]
MAPAKNKECGKAAIDHGADAVYIGAHRFGARAAAGNSIDDIRELCEYAHMFKAKVYVTVNTIIYDNELEATRQMLAGLEEAGVDAVLVQDMAVAAMLKGSRMALHASTQTDNRSAEKVAWLQSLGFKRVVLARELSANEIYEIHKAVPDVELEVFVHGALCVSYSGLCYASQYCFNRSANRGECAQFCRLSFNLEDSKGNILEHDRHLLSLRDMNRINNLEQLVEAGAVSFKIEGRLKDIGYVKNVTAAYSQQLDSIISRNPEKYRRASLGRCNYSFNPDLRKTFNRGFTNYFINGRKPDIASWDTPKAIGEYVGTVKEIRGGTFTVAGTKYFANGDGLCFINDSHTLEGFRINKVENNRLHPLKMPSNLRRGTALYRNNDREFERILSKQSSVRKIEVQMKLYETENGIALTMTIPGIHTVTVHEQLEHQTAMRQQNENISRQLQKLGGSIFECRNIDIQEDFNLFVPGSILSSLRRKATAAMEELCAGKEKRQGSVSEKSAAIVPAIKKTCNTGHSAFPGYGRNTYMHNISNTMAQRFYAGIGLDSPQPAFEKRQTDKACLMQCRYCIRHTMGYCMKNGGKKPYWEEPLYLVSADKRRFKLEFDCAKCQMNIIAEK